MPIRLANAYAALLCFTQRWIMTSTVIQIGRFYVFCVPRQWWYNKASYDCVKVCSLSVASQCWLIQDEGIYGELYICASIDLREWVYLTHKTKSHCGTRGVWWNFATPALPPNRQVRKSCCRELSRYNMTFRFLTGVLFYIGDYYDFGDLVTLHRHATVPSGFDCSTRFCGES